VPVPNSIKRRKTMRLWIESVENGFFISIPDGDGGSEKMVFEEPDNAPKSPDPGTVGRLLRHFLDIIHPPAPKVGHIRRLLYSILEELGAYGSDHDAERVRIVIEKKGVDYDD
jgi:hypothetical protein